MTQPNGYELAMSTESGGLSQMLELASRLKGATGMVPEHLKSEGQILATILAGRELGLGPMAAMRGLHVVRGKVGADYSLWVALLKRNGYKVEWLEKSAERCTLKLTAPDGSTHKETWDKDRAVKAGLWNSGEGWKKYPETMLSARCVTSAGRAFAAEVLAGGYSMDELDEIRGGAVESQPHHNGANRLAARLGVQEESPAISHLDDALRMIARCTNDQELMEAGASIKDLGLTLEDKLKASKAYTEKRDLLAAKRAEAEAEQQEAAQ